MTLFEITRKSLLGKLNNDKHVVYILKKEKYIYIFFFMFRGYAEFIESQLMSMDMKVNMVFPPAGTATSKIVTGLIKRKCLFCVMINEENKMSQTVTLHVLQGALQGELVI